MDSTARKKRWYVIGNLLAIDDFNMLLTVGG